MNHEILSSLASKEYIKSFLERGIRTDKRNLEERREYTDISNFLSTEEYSHMTSLGSDNRVLGVLKKKPNSNKSNGIQVEYNSYIFNISIDICQLELNDSLILDYIDKLLNNNIHFHTDEYTYELYIRILSNDGNIYDSISHMILLLFSNETIKSSLFYIKKEFSTLTFSAIDEFLLYDTSNDEAVLSNSVFNLILFSDKSLFLHKISGRSLSIVELTKVIDNVSKNFSFNK